MSRQDLGTKPVKLGKSTLPLGFANFVMVRRIISVNNPNSAPSRKLRQKAKELDLLIDVTHGHKTRSILVSDSNHVILSAVSCETIQSRIEILCNQCRVPGGVGEEI